MTKADHNPLRAALERFGRERGQPQPRLYRTVDEEREFREAKEKYGIKDHWPQGQPQSSTAASPDEVERRRRAYSTAIEQSQPQQALPDCACHGGPQKPHCGAFQRCYWQYDLQRARAAGPATAGASPQRLPWPR